MSRLIFEGNTEERFGELFPNPFIEQIRLFDNAIQVDVGLYFEVPTDEDEANDYIAYMQGNLNIFGAFFERFQFDRITEQKLISGDIIKQFYKNSFFTLNFDDNDYRKQIDLKQVELFFNSEGKRFAKALINFVYPGSPSLREFYTNPDDRYFATFTSFIRPVEQIDGYSTGHNALYNMPSEQEERLKNQTSDLVYEKIFRRPTVDEETRGLQHIVNTEPKEVYLQSDGHYYQKTPLQSLDKRYRKIDLVDHTQVANVINPIVAPFIDSFEEANMISMTLQEFSNSPRLLTELQKNINKFSNKSRVTTIGKLYESLVDAVADIDNILIGSDRLQKRLIPNTRIVDNRGTTFTTEPITIISTANTRGHQGRYNASQYLSMPFTARTVQPGAYDYYYDADSNGYEPLEFYIKNLSFIFFDYEKSLNYNSYISEVLNPYNMLELYGKNSLNEFYQNNEIEVNKKTSTKISSPFGTAVVDEEIVANIRNEFNHIEYERYNSDDDDTTTIYAGTSKSYYTSYDEDNHFFQEEQTTARTEETGRPIMAPIYSQIIEKAFDTYNGLDDYRLKCFTLTDLESVEDAIRSTRVLKYETIVTIDDQTMQFYDNLRKEALFIYSELLRYFDAANDFCSYNTLDGRFNDFFLDSISNLFGNSVAQAAADAAAVEAEAARAAGAPEILVNILEEKAAGLAAEASAADALTFPWVQGPRFYYHIMSLIENSWNFDGALRIPDGGLITDRKIDGTAMDLRSINLSVVSKYIEISPKSGTLPQVADFVQKFKILVDLLDVGGQLDDKCQIYNVSATGEVTLKNVGERTVERTFTIDEKIISSFEIAMPEEEEDTTTTAESGPPADFDRAPAAPRVDTTVSTRIEQERLSGISDRMTEDGD